MNKQDKITSLLKYAAGLRDRLAGKFAEYEQDQAEALKTFLRTDLQKTERKIAELKEAK